MKKYCTYRADNREKVDALEKIWASRINNAGGNPNHGLNVDQMRNLYKVKTAIQVTGNLDASIDVSDKWESMTAQEQFDYMMDWAENCAFSDLLICRNTTHDNVIALREELTVMYKCDKSLWV